MRNAFVGVLFAFLYVQTSFACDFIIEPYLFVAKDLKPRIAWTCKSPNTSSKETVELTEKIGDHTQVFQTLIPDIQKDLYVATIPGNYCGSNPSLQYKVSGMPEPKSISSIPCADEQNATFTFLADTQQFQKHTKKFARELAKFPSQFIIHGGDVVQHGGDKSEWEEYFSSMSAVGGNRFTISAIGNHEYRGDPNDLLWNRYFQSDAKEAFYSFEAGPARIIVLNSNFESDPSLIPKQVEFLENELRIPAPWKIVIFHHPPYSLGIAQSKIPGLKQEHVFIRSAFVPLFEQYDVDLVLNGHVHLYERSQKAGVNYITTGPAGGKMGVFNPTRNAPFTYHSERTRTMIHVQAGLKTLQLLVSAIDGNIFDTIQLNK